DAELDGFVDVLARRIASFDRRPLARAKNLINQVSLPSADRLLDALNAFQTATSKIGGPRCSARSSRRSHHVAMGSLASSPLPQLSSGDPHAGSVAREQMPTPRRLAWASLRARSP